MTDGKAAEDAVDEYLQSQGYRMIARNLRLKQGEIDWLGWQGDILTLVEVKASKVSPELAAGRIDTRKLNRLQHLMEELLTLEPYRKVIEYRILAIIAFKAGSEQGWEFSEFVCMGGQGESDG
ncbi:MAG: YraN family protein [bacterium]|nr:YraN family protein [bacterium]